MKIVDPQEIAATEKRAFAEGVSEIELMENAGAAVADYILNLVRQNGLAKNILILAGKGNNGGDGFVAGRHLIGEGCTVHAIQLQNQLSPLCLEQKKRFIQEGGTLISFEEMEDQISSYGIIVDGLFGTGFGGVIEGELKNVIHLANQSEVPIIAIDIPSGLNGQTGEVKGPCIQATVTLTLTAPKIGFFIGEGWNFIGNLEVISIGLPDIYYDQMEPFAYLLERRTLRYLLPPIVRNRQKYERGHAVLMAGSPGMTGSAFMASFGCFRGGAGYVHLLIRDGMSDAFHALPELITPNISNMNRNELLDLINGANAFLAGPGFGRGEAEQRFMQEVLPHVEVPIVIDADALYLLAHHDVALPEKALLTPHHGEMARLLHQQKQPFSIPFLRDAQEYAKEMGVHILLKGGPTFYLAPSDDIPIVIPFGDPGMATAGSGDLLGGVIVSLLAQGLGLSDAALLGAGLHGIAGEIAAQQVTSYSMKAMDIGQALPAAYQSILS